MRDWAAIHAALARVIGERGVAALYKRTLHLARASHPWLAGANDASAAPGDFAALHAALARQDDSELAAAHARMLTILREVLASLIGATLAERLLQSLPTAPPGGNAVQDESP